MLKKVKFVRLGVTLASKESIS